MTTCVLLSVGGLLAVLFQEGIRFRIVAIPGLIIIFAIFVVLVLASIAIVRWLFTSVLVSNKPDDDPEKGSENPDLNGKTGGRSTRP